MKFEKQIFQHDPCNYRFFTVREEVNLKFIRMNATKNVLETQKFVLD